MLATMICAITMTTTINGLTSSTASLPPGPAGYVAEYTNCCPSGIAWVRPPDAVDLPSDHECDPDHPRGNLSS